jgi:antitoxin component YwqK of YwqJK toxin-antitoxin module
VSIDDNGKISAYAEGINDSLEERTFENFYNNQGKMRNYYWIWRNKFALIRKGIEVTFHPNGHPATYHTIVRDRLYGKQIEWNDKGEVLSNVDLDIPKTWTDIPKMINSPSQK